MTAKEVTAVKLSDPILTVSPGVHGKVLSVLARTDTPLTGRTIASLVPNASLSGVQKVLKDLVRNGIVRLEPAGKAQLHTLNREHLAYPAVHSLVHLRDELIARISSEATSWNLPAVAVWLFGSAARGEAEPGSDIDILLIRPDNLDDSDPAWLLQVDTLSDHITRWTGNGCEILELSTVDVEDMVRRDERLIAELRRDAIRLVGAAPRQTLHRKVDR
jgi:predicted nucleotidyltransferase